MSVREAYRKGRSVRMRNYFYGKSAKIQSGERDENKEVACNGMKERKTKRVRECEKVRKVNKGRKRLRKSMERKGVEEEVIENGRKSEKRTELYAQKKEDETERTEGEKVRGENGTKW